MSDRDGNIGIDQSKRPLVVDPSFAAYAEKHNVFDLLEGMTKDLIVSQPPDPLEFIIAFLKQRRVPRVFVHGPSGSGAAALCGSIAGKTEAVNLEIGAIVAAAVEQETDPGVEAKPFVEAGDTIPNKVLVPLVLDRLAEGDCKRNGFVLRGFPKTRAQAVGLQIQGLLPTHVFILDGTTEALATQNLEDAAGLNASAAVPSAQSIRDDLEDFRLNLASYSATFDTVVRRLDANLPPADVFAEAWTRLCTSNQSNAPFIPRVVILGARGSGDQDQANSLARKYGAIAIHFQDVLQKAVDVGDAVSRTIKSSLKTGAPIPDSVLHALVAKEISQLACQTQGWVLTGYPKTASQARSLADAGLGPNRAFFLDVEKNTALDRLEGKRIDPISGNSYHVLYDPAPGGEIGIRLKQHPANTQSELEKHVESYMSNYDELAGCYAGHVRVDANFDSETVMGYIDGNLVRPVAPGFPGP